MHNSMHNSTEDDGWQHYRILSLSRTATQEDVKQAYRTLARVLHPDKGGNAAAFAALQAAFETLSDPQARAAYDSLAADLRFRPGAAAPYSNIQQAPGGPPPPPPGLTEAMLLQQLLQRCAAHPYAVFDPHKQLCVTCELCRRPAAQQCWTCGMDICEFCIRRQHWKGSVSLHWPLVNQPGSMLEQLGKRELELKRREDGQAYKEAQPDYRPHSELQVLRQFQDAVVDILQQKQQQHLASGHTQGYSSSSRASAVGTTNSSSRESCVATGPHPTGPAGSLAQHDLNQHTRTPPRQSSNAAAGRQAPSAFALPPAGGLLKPGPSSSRDSSSSVGRDLVTWPDSHALALPRHRKQANRCWAAWQNAPKEVKHAMLSYYDNRLARFYMWAQTECSILLALQMPTGGGKVPPQLTLEPTQHTLMVQHQGFAPVLSRAWSGLVDAADGISSWTSADGQLLVVKVLKAEPGRVWTSCFQGDPYMARHLQSSYRLVQLPSEVHLELPVPFWVHPAEDVQVDIGTRELTVVVDGVMKLQRTFFRDEVQAAKQGSSFKVVDAGSSSWCVLDQGHKSATAQQPPSSGSIGNGSSSSSNTAGKAPLRRMDKLLSISLALPPPTDEEVMYKKGVRQNNASTVRSCPNGAGKSGAAFFLEDEDEWGLQAVLQAMMFQETGRTWLSPQPWELAAGAGSLISSSSNSVSQGINSHDSLGRHECVASSGRWVEDEQLLPPEVARHLQWVRAASETMQGVASDGLAALEGPLAAEE